MGRVLWINGCFSTGKTTVAALLVDRIPDSFLWAEKTVDWVLPALADSRFAVHIDAEMQTAPEVADDILRRIWL